MQVLLHDGGVRTLSNVTPFLDAAVPEYSLTVQAHITCVRIRFGFSRHLELFERRFREFFFNFFLKVHKLQLNFGVYVPATFQWTASQSNDVALRGALFAAHVLLSVRDTLAYAVHVVRFGKTMLSVSSARLIGIHLALLHLLGPLLTASVTTVALANNLARCQFRRLVTTG